MAEEHRARVVIEGDTSGFARSADAGRTSAQRFEQAVSKNKDAVGKFGGALKSAVPNLVALTTNTGNATKSATGLASAVFAGAKAFGPWGLAIGFAGDALLGLVTSSGEAEKAVRAVAKAQQEERRAAEEMYAATERLVFWTAANSEATKKATAAIDEKIEKQEIEIAWMRGLGEETQAAELALMKLSAERLRAIPVGDALTAEGRAELEVRRANNLAMADEIDKRVKLTELERKAAGTRVTFEAAAKRSGGGRPSARRGTKENDALFGSALGFGGFSGNVAGARESASFNAEAGRVGAMQRGGGDTRGANDAQYAADARLRAIEVERATTGETIALINAERDARMQLLQTQIDASTTGAERSALKQEQEQVAHEATLQRIAQEQAAEEKRMAKSVAYQNMAASLANSGVALGGKIAQAAGVSAKKREKIERGLGAAQAIVIGSLEVVKAAAAFALPFGVGVPEGIAHTAAAAVAFSTAAALGAGGGGGGASGGGASAGGGGGSQTPRGAASPGSTSPIPGSPSPQAPSVGGGGSDRAPRRIVQITGPIHLYGTPERDWLSSLDESLEVHRAGSRKRRAS